MPLAQAPAEKEGGGGAGHKVIQRDTVGAGGESEVCESSNGKADTVRE